MFSRASALTRVNRVAGKRACAAKHRVQVNQILLLRPTRQFKLLDRVGGMLTVVTIHLSQQPT